MADNPMREPWAIAIQDQVMAAVAADDWPMVARITLDGYLTALKGDFGDKPVPFEVLVGSMHHLRNDNLVLWCAEACRRLHELGDK